MIGTVDDDQFLGLFEFSVKAPHAFERADLVGFTLNEELRLRARQRVGEAVVHARHRRNHRWRDADQRRNARVDGANFERDPRAEREPSGPQRNPRILRGDVIQGGAEILLLALAFSERAVALPDTSKVEPEDSAANARKSLRPLKHGLRMHRPTVLRMRMGEDDSGMGRPGRYV